MATLPCLSAATAMPASAQATPFSHRADVCGTLSRVIVMEDEGSPVMGSRTHLARLIMLALLGSCVAVSGQDLVIRPEPQIMQSSEGGFTVSSGTRIVIAEGWPAYVRVSAQELAQAISAGGGPKPDIVETARAEYRKGDIIVAPYEWLGRYLGFIEPMPQAIVRPAPLEGYNIRITPDYLVLAGNSERGCFMGLQTLIQIARQTAAKDGSYLLPGLLVADWPDHDWRTLQHPLGVYGTTYDRGEHRYRLITRVDLLERSIRLAAYSKLTGLCVEVGTGMAYQRHPEIFVEGFATNSNAEVRAAVDLAKSLGLYLVPFQNASGAHDIWIGPYAYAALDSDMYEEALFDVLDETIEVFRPAHLHIGMDEDVVQDFDGNALRDVETHKKVILDCYEFLRRRGVSTLVWNDGITLLGDGEKDLPRDIIVLPWYYGGMDFTYARHYIGQGFRVLCSPWSQWHVENDQFYSICASTIRSGRLLGMAGTIWYPIGPDGENDYRRCLVKAAMAFWSPLKASEFPSDAEYYAPAYDGLSRDAFLQMRPVPASQDELAALIEAVTGPGEDHFACEEARERLVKAGTSVVAPLLDAIARGPDEISPWAEGTLRRIAREPLGDRAVMIKALEESSKGTGEVRALALELLGVLGDAEFLAAQDPDDPAVCLAMGVSGDERFLQALLKSASGGGRGRVSALLAIGSLKGTNELLSLENSWPAFPDDAKEAYAKALAAQASEAAISILGKLIEDENSRVRFRAAIGLGATRSAAAAPYILKLLDDKTPEVFKVGLWWCTDTFILAPEEYFPKLVSRLRLDEDREIVRPIVDALTLMWEPGLGQWLSKGEDPAKRLEYATLPVWNDESLISALNTMIEYKDARPAVDAIVVLLRMGRAPEAQTTADVIRRFDIEDVRWFCIRIRNHQLAQAAPIMKRLWGIEDQLVRTFILQYCSAVRSPETFQIAYDAYAGLPESDPLRMSAVGTMAAHLDKLDEHARLAIPLMLEYYDKGGFEFRSALEAALSRVSGREAKATPNDEAADIEKRLSEWKEWWNKTAEDGN